MDLRRRLLALVVIGLALPVAAQTSSDPRLSVQIVYAPLNGPTTMAFIGDGDILSLQKHDGQVRRIIGGAIQAGNVLDVAVNAASERGLLGIAVDPDFINNGHVYLYYTEAAVDGGVPLGNRVYRYRWNASALVDPLLILDLPATPGPNHDGGIVTFGADDKLYAVIGDLNRAGKLQNVPNGPEPDDTGVILRVNGDGTAPPDNPFPGALSRVFSYGVRNSYGLAVDPLTGAVWDTENGAGDYDEVNHVASGRNSG